MIPLETLKKARRLVIAVPLEEPHGEMFFEYSLNDFTRVWNYVNEFCGRHNVRELDTIDQMRLLAKGLDGKRLRFRDLIADTGVSGAAT